jgi:hypothetical protein
MAAATFGIVDGEYQRWGFEVESGRLRSLCTTMTRRRRFGEAASIEFMNES